MSLIYRYASLEDLPKIVATYNSTVASRLVTADLEPVSLESKLPWFEQHNQVSRPLWLITQNEEYLGWMSYNSFYGRPAYAGTAELSIYLEEGARGKGIGNACLIFAVEQAPKFGIENLLGFIFGHNLQSIHLFKKHGFETWAQLPGVANMDGLHRDLLILGKKL